MMSTHFWPHNVRYLPSNVRFFGSFQTLHPPRGVFSTDIMGALAPEIFGHFSTVEKFLLKFIYSEKATRRRRFRKILWSSQNIWTLKISTHNIKILNNVWVKKTWTKCSSVSLLRFVQVFLTQTLRPCPPKIWHH